MSANVDECCLCYMTPCSNYKVMQNEMGECTDVYDVTVKYFDPMLITEKQGDDSSSTTRVRVLCQECWVHIDDFHEFQKSVLESRSLHHGTEVITMSLDVKQDHISEFLQDEELPQEDSFNENDFGEMNSAMDDENTVEIIIERNFEEESVGITLPEPDGINKRESASKKETRRCRKKEAVTENVNNNKLKQKEKMEGTTLNIKKEETANKVTKDTSKAAYTLEKGRESDTFIAKWKPNLECDLCPVTATNFDLLRTHFREVHKTRFYIKCCDRKFYRRCILVDHIRLHVNPDTHKCDICGKPSTSKYNLKLHKKIVHNEEREYECEICHKNFNHKPTLERHLLTHVTGSKEFFCKECGKGYVLEVQLNTHMRNVHNGVHICDQCGKTFHSGGALKKHLMEHGIIPHPKFPCDVCEVELKSNEALKRHKAAYHHDGTTVYICSVCGKVAASEHALLSHKKFVHEDKRKHKCTFCDKAFRTPIVLREHIATHTGEDLYQCPHCPQTFKTNANMHHHRKRVHPVEWKEARKSRLNLPKVNVDQLRRQVII